MTLRVFKDGLVASVSLVGFVKARKCSRPCGESQYESQQQRLESTVYPAHLCRTPVGTDSYCWGNRVSLWPSLSPFQFSGPKRGESQVTGLGQRGKEETGWVSLSVVILDTWTRSPQLLVGVAEVMRADSWNLPFFIILSRSQKKEEGAVGAGRGDNGQ